MPRFYVKENNSGGHTVALGVLDDPRPHWVWIDASSADEAIARFEDHFGLDWNYQNSYEGNSCNCCGRRFSLYAPKGHEKSSRDAHDQVITYESDSDPWLTVKPKDGSPSYMFRISSHDRGCKLEDAPVRTA